MRQFIYALPLIGVLSLSAETYRWILMDLQRFPSEEILRMGKDQLGNKYFASRKGLTLIDRQDETTLFTQELSQGRLPSDSILRMAVDRNRALWVGTDGGGLARLENGRWESWTRTSTGGGLPDDFVTGVAAYRDEIWVSTRNGFAVLRNRIWTTYSGTKISGRLPHRHCTSISVDSSGGIWIGTLGGLVRFEGSSWQTFTHANTQGGLPHNSVSDLLVSSDGHLWVSTQAGIAEMKKGQWKNFGPESGLGELAHEMGYALSPASHQGIWACLRGGAARYDGKKWEIFTRDNTSGIKTRYVYDVLEEDNGRIWFATQKGVAIRVPVAEED
jgi:ligand-binding sensor domain-containing protein